MGRRAKTPKARANATPPLAGKTSKDEGTKVRDLEKRLAEALEQQTATSEILRVISSSPTDIQPVFDAIAAAATTLCEADHTGLFRFDGDLIHFVAHHGRTPEEISAARRVFPQPTRQHSVTGRAILAAAVVQIADVSKDPELEDALRIFRTVLSVPLIRDGRPLGAITVARRVVRPFTDTQIELLKTFADQAVIAIEHVRLFNETKEALEQQTATAEILSVISRSPTDVRPVFETILERAATLCEAQLAHLWLYEGGEQFRLGAGYGSRPDHLQWLEQGLHRIGRPFFRESGPWRVGQVLDVRDTEPYRRGEALWIRTADHEGMRTLLGVPLVKDGRLVGSIAIYRREVRPFTDAQVALVKTFADQAVIAIENVRLFTETKEALEQQTATSEILKVISRSPTDIQPVFDAIAENAARLCSVEDVFIVLVAGDALRAVAATGQMTGLIPGYNARRVPVSRTSVAGRVIVDRTTMHIDDLAAVPEDELPDGRALQRMFNHRTILATPLLREGAALGAIVVFRLEVRPFSERQQDLLQTFADQAVIAIENVRLFTELQARTGDLTRSVAELTALGDVSRAVSSTLELDTVLDTIAARANQLAGADGCTIWEYDEEAEQFRQRASRYADEGEAAVLDPIGRATPIPKGQGLAGRAADLREPVQLPDIAIEGVYESPVRVPLLQAGYRALLVVPLLREEEIIGVLGVIRKTPGDFAPEIIRLLQTFATQSALAIQNARLFRELADKSRQLEAASRHKSEFLANMSHELRTPLNAIIGFSEVLTERMFGELNEKQEEYLKDIHASGQHLLSLINDILDLSKIEAGRMELELNAFDLPTAIDNALILVRERAARRGIGLGRTIDERVGLVHADERKVKQVLLNLLSNALKFTPEGGRVNVRATVVDGLAEVSVTDTGVGIAPADQEAVFEEFRQVGTADKKVEGTGLGLTLSRKFVELHGGRIWVKSQVGQGSTFTFTLPVRHEPSSGETAPR